MSEQYITCPNCNSKIPLTKTITNQISQELQVEFNKKLQSCLKEAEEEHHLKIAEITRNAKMKAEDELSIELQDLQQQINEKSEKLKKAQENELELRKREREIEEKLECFDLELKRKLDEEKSRTENEIRERLDLEFQLKEAEKNKIIGDMQKQIEELRRKADQGSPQTRGELLEQNLEKLLKEKFPYDKIEPVPKGVRGADIVHTVCNDMGENCGCIAWESKKTKSWNSNWISKLKDDKIATKADIGVIMAEVLPPDVHNFDQVDGIWVTNYASLIGLATALRMHLIQIKNEKMIQTGREEKQIILYNYLSSPEFRNNIEAIAESFISMQEDLEKEKRAMQSIWAKREKQIMRIIQNTAHLYGNLQGIMGQALEKIEDFELIGLSPNEMPEPLLPVPKKSHKYSVFGEKR